LRNITPHHQDGDKVLSALGEKRFYTSPGDTLAAHRRRLLHHISLRTSHTRARKHEHTREAALAGPKYGKFLKTRMC